MWDHQCVIFLERRERERERRKQHAYAYTGKSLKLALQSSISNYPSFTVVGISREEKLKEMATSNGLQGENKQQVYDLLVSELLYM